jgi:hypothetical protein
MLRRICLLLCLVSLFAGCDRSGPTQSAALKETTDWINDTYNPRPGEMSYNNHGINWMELKHATQNERTTSLHIENCVATIEEKQTPGFPMASEQVLVSDLQTVKMADLDPSRIKTEITSSEAYGMRCDDPNLNLNCNQADIGLHTYNDRRLIKGRRILEYRKLTGPDHRNVSDTTEDSTYLFVNDLEYLPRFVAALKKEIELCGGKPSAF